MAQVSYPNLILAGTPKSGTSSLFQWLVAHPEITPISMDETYYLLDKNNPYLGEFNYHKNGMDAYITAEKSQKTKISLEYCTHYLYQETAINVLSSLNPQPHIIFLLRQPSIRTFSSFSFSKHNKLSIDNQLNFNHFIDLLFQKNIGEIESKCLDEKSFFARKMEVQYSQYHEYLIRWKQNFLEKNIRIILFENLVKDPCSVLRSICEDLEIDASFYDGYSFVGQNKTTKVKNKWLHRKFLDFKSKVPHNKLTIGLSKLYWSMQGNASPLDKLDESSFKKLNEYFDSHNTKLSKDFNLNLDIWKEFRY